MATCRWARGRKANWNGRTRHITVDTVDVSPDSTTFATGTRTKEASIWSITTGQRLVGPLQHDQDVNGIRFSPNGDRIATACYTDIRIFDSHSGVELVTIDTDLSLYGAITPFAWSNNGQKLFAVSLEDKIRVFDTSTGTQRAETQIPRDSNNTRSIAIAANSKFIATFADNSIWLLDTSTLACIGPVIEDDERIRSVAISPDNSRLATGRHDGKIIIRDLGKILPDLYGPFNVSARDKVQQDEQPLTSGDHDGKVSSSPKDKKSGPPESRGHSRDNDDLLEVAVEVPSSVPIQFDYDESLSAASSVDVREDEIPPVGSSHPISQPSDILPVTSPESCGEENLDTVESPRRAQSIFRKWLQRKSNRGPTPPKPGRPSGKSRQPPSTDRRSPSHSSPRVDATNKGPSWMAAGQRRPSRHRGKRINHLLRLLFPSIRTRTPCGVDRVPRAQTKPTQRNKGLIHLNPRPGGSMYWEDQAMLSLRSGCPHG